jgi:hypothetical protein
MKDVNIQGGFSSENIYSWDTNNSFNKVDNFVGKKIQIKNNMGDVVREVYGDIVKVQDLPSGVYTMEISYTLDVPREYFEFI